MDRGREAYLLTRLTKDSHTVVVQVELLGDTNEGREAVEAGTVGILAEDDPLEAHIDPLLGEIPLSHDGRRRGEIPYSSGGGHHRDREAW